MKLHYLIINLMLAALLIFVMPIYAWSELSMNPATDTHTTLSQP